MTDDRLFAESEAEKAYQALGGVISAKSNLGKDTEISRLKVRLQTLRSWIHPADWEGLVRALPEADEWFNEDGIPK